MSETGTENGGIVAHGELVGEEERDARRMEDRWRWWGVKRCKAVVCCCESKPSRLMNPAGSGTIRAHDFRSSIHSFRPPCKLSSSSSSIAHQHKALLPATISSCSPHFHSQRVNIATGSEIKPPLFPLDQSSSRKQRSPVCNTIEFALAHLHTPPVVSRASLSLVSAPSP
ncbi:hypothetical protein BD779DRAFT_297364 [Infundibulicybe gibba]|nr:hypothetical protein BD779DRAFT_297364 [Infundibulicybe gibba]